MLTLDAPYGFLVCFILANIDSETTKTRRARGAFIGDGQTGLFNQRVGEQEREREKGSESESGRESLVRKPERQCLVTLVVAIVCLLQPSVSVEY